MSARRLAGVVVAGAVAATVLGAVPPGAHAVAGGAPVAEGSYAFTAKIAVGELRGCSGVLVAPRWVLTSNTCFPDAHDGVPPAPSTVTVGAAPPATITGLVARSGRTALLAKLDRPIAGIAPVPVSGVAPSAGEQLRAVGYGRTATEWAPERPHAGTVTVESVTATTANIASPDVSICKGDTGGPLLRDRAGRAELVAIHYTSWQAGCLGAPETRRGAVEARVDDLRDWVRATTRALPAGTPAQLTAGRFTGDTHADLAALDGGKLYLYPGLARGGGFGPRSEVAGSWAHLRDLAAGQFAGNARTDLLGVDAESGTLWLYPDVTGARTSLGTGWDNLRDLAADDVTADGRTDVLAVDDTTGVLWLYPGTAGGLGARSQLATGWQDLRGLVAGDYTRDGRADVLAVDATGTLWLYPGTDAGLGARASLGDGWAESDELTAADVTHDGNADVLAVDEPTGALKLAAGTGPGALAANTTIAWATPYPRDAALALYDYPSSRTVLFSWDPTSNGGLGNPVNRWDSGAGNFEVPRSKPVRGDFNGDGLTDVGVFYDYSNGRTALFTWTGKADGVFDGAARRWDVTGWETPRMKPFAGDFNGDGRTDLGAFYNYPNNRTVLFTWTAKGGGDFDGPVSRWDSGAGNFEQPRVKPMVGDFNGDGLTDVGGFYDYGNSRTALFTWSAKPDGAFEPPARRWDVTGWETPRMKPFAADVNGDGRADLGAFYDYPGSRTVLFTWTAKGGGDFDGPVNRWDSGPGNFEQPRTKPFVGDFNGDGLADIGAFYDYSNSRTALFAWSGKPDGNVQPVARLWDVNGWETPRINAF